MHTILLVLVFILGLIIFSFTIGNIILILAVAFPLTKKLRKSGLIRNANNIVWNSYLVSLGLQIIIFGFITSIFWIYGSSSFLLSLLIGYGSGIIGILKNIKKYRLNIANFSDYFTKNKEFFWEELIAMYDESPRKLYDYIKMLTK